MPNSINLKGDTISTIIFENRGKLIAEIRQRKGETFISDTTFYNGNKVVKGIIIDSKNNYRHLATYKYDNNGNEIVMITYR